MQFETGEFYELLKNFFDERFRQLPCCPPFVLLDYSPKETQPSADELWFCVERIHETIIAVSL